MERKHHAATGSGCTHRGLLKMQLTSAVLLLLEEEKCMWQFCLHAYMLDSLKPVKKGFVGFVLFSFV